MLPPKMIDGKQFGLSRKKAVMLWLLCWINWLGWSWLRRKVWAPLFFRMDPPAQYTGTFLFKRPE